jgi:hypothetical protein
LIIERASTLIEKAHNNRARGGAADLAHSTHSKAHDDTHFSSVRAGFLNRICDWKFIDRFLSIIQPNTRFWIWLCSWCMEEWWCFNIGLQTAFIPNLSLHVKERISKK